MGEAFYDFVRADLGSTAQFSIKLKGTEFSDKARRRRVVLVQVICLASRTEFIRKVEAFDYFLVGIRDNSRIIRRRLGAVVVGAREKEERGKRDQREKTDSFHKGSLREKIRHKTGFSILAYRMYF